LQNRNKELLIKREVYENRIIKRAVFKACRLVMAESWLINSYDLNLLKILAGFEF